MSKNNAATGQRRDGNKLPKAHHVLDGELTTITSNIDLPLDRYVIIIFQREGGRWCGQQQSRVGAVVIGSFMAMAWWRMAWGLRWACLLSMGNDNMKNKKEERERGLGDIDHVSHRHITCCAYLLDR